MLIRVASRPAWLADVGFGGLTLTGPALLDTGLAQPTPHELFRLVEARRHLAQEAQVRVTHGCSLYALRPAAPACLSTTKRPETITCRRYPAVALPLQHLICARALPGRRLALLEPPVRGASPADGRSERCTLASGDALRAVLAGEFAIALPASPTLAARLDSLP